MQNKIETAIWIALQLFQRNKVSGSSANMSFAEGDTIYITGSGTCFGALTPDSFTAMTKDGQYISGPKPSKEFELHKTLYVKGNNVQAVIHVHSPFATLWSCLTHKNMQDIIPAFTPYLRMRIGKVAGVPYAKPGSQELFNSFNEHFCETNGYLLMNHGPIVGSKNLLQAFYDIEEIEESAKISWMLQGKNVKPID